MFRRTGRKNQTATKNRMTIAAYKAQLFDVDGHMDMTPGAGDSLVVFIVCSLRDAGAQPVGKRNLSATNLLGKSGLPEPKP
ncbi:hypothetical protein NDU88_001754 [Pleurodeles waltl]|uniref:Uncharacterized protein n=1 Tax=Pleurodeles waltl TaxID=8319 RepID=A0AAV7NEB3_PLEWA|nr:hypothetical protein NDU88_001754 [Pleurodeles waltl]